MNVTESTHDAGTKQRVERGTQDEAAMPPQIREEEADRAPGVVHVRTLTATGRLCTVGRPAAVFLD